VRQQWVHKTLIDCFQASARLNLEQRRVGRRFYVSVRARDLSDGHHLWHCECADFQRTSAPWRNGVKASARIRPSAIMRALEDGSL